MIPRRKHRLYRWWYWRLNRLQQNRYHLVGNSSPEITHASHFGMLIIIIFYSVTYCMTFRENREFVFISIMQFMVSTNSRMRFGLQIVFVCLYITPSHYHYCANFIWRHWTYKTPVRYKLSSVCVRLSIFSQLSIILYVGLCVFSLPISFVMIERIYILCLLIIIIKSEVWTFTHCSWNNGMRCMSFYILNKSFR